MFELSMLPEMRMRVTPALLNLTQMLAMPSMALHQLVQQELTENPALEEVESYAQACDRCGSLVLDGLCLSCANSDSLSNAPAELRDDVLDPLLFVASPRSLTEMLLDDLYATLPSTDHPIALALVGNLDEHGFLTFPTLDIAIQLGIEPERVEAVLLSLQELGPPGIATANARECLLAQVAAFEHQGINCDHVRAIISDHFEDLGAGRFKQIARQLRISHEQMDAARAFIKHQLWPYPAQAALPEDPSSQRPRYRVADLSIQRRDDEFIVEVQHSPRRILRLNPLYQELARRGITLSEEERAHVQEYILRARTFLTNLRQREVTLQRIGESIVERQREFLLRGVRYLVPMTRSEIAVDLGVHESTVSRATAEKSVLLPNGTLMPISELFVAARNVQDVLRELVTTEPNPLSDNELARQLSERGYPIARRTVAKYRDILKIPPSHLR
ncbi:MAG: RNA polymerase factor sigma-54 [Oscillochloridaceae bacterium umkhey_bin13]